LIRGSKSTSSNWFIEEETDEADEVIVETIFWNHRLAKVETIDSSL
jgi:hypothetical protein